VLRIILKEGKAIQATEDMRLFADEVVEKLQPFLHDPQLIVSEDETKVFYWREVEGPYGNSKRVGIRFKELKPGWPKDAKIGTAEVKAGSLVLIFYKTREGFPLDLEPIHPTQIIHELIHCFDPKLEKKVVYNGMKDRNQQTTEEYYKDEAEQDAYMRQDAIVLANNFDKFSIERAKELLSKKVSDPANLTRRMKVWKTDPKMWRKFLNTVYDEVVSRRLPKPKPSKFQQAKQDKE
jgi:hypothetical protein